jgi:diguanylate cyclase (GGDEF)-like protein
MDDEAIGVINITNRKNSEAFRQEDEEILGALASQAAVAIARTRLYEAAITDGMTRLYIRRFIMHRLLEETKKSRRYGAVLSVIMCDIDHFKRVNDTWGHAAGDAVIIQVAAILKAGLRVDVDAAGRYGGEEFLLLLPHTPGESASVAAERLRARIAETVIGIGDGKSLQAHV